jgi:hypothetical protein
MTAFSFDLYGDLLSESEPDPDGTYVLNEEHAVQAINHLIDAFKYGPRNQAILSGIGAQLQELEDAYWALYNAFDGDTATGDQLDLLGVLVGEKRQGRSDDDYRAAVKVRIKVNCSDGSIPTLLTISMMMVPTAGIVVQEPATATLQFDFTTTGTTTLRTLYQMLHRAKGGGVKIIVSYGGGIVGSEDGSPAGAIIGAEDGSPAGFAIGGEM